VNIMMKRQSRIVAVLLALAVLVLGTSAMGAQAATRHTATTASVVTPASASGRCAGGHLCLFTDSGFGGSYNQENTGCVDITGFSTANKVSSIDFPGPGSYEAWFFDNGNLVLALNQGHYLKNLASDSSASGGNANDKIDEVFIC
jgi:hypothetical protein